MILKTNQDKNEIWAIFNYPPPTIGGLCKTWGEKKKSKH